MPKQQKSPEHLRVDSLIETIQQHPVAVLEAERQLTAVKWFEYRFMSPKKANRLFMKCYQKIYSRKYAEEVDVERADSVSGVHVFTMKDNARERSQLVAARQRADRLGIPYLFYIEAAFDFALRRGNNRRRFPRPNQLHGNRASEGLCRQFILTRWREYVANGLFRVEHPIYLIENYRGLPAQDDFRRFVLKYVDEVSMPFHRAIRTFTYERQQVPAELFRFITSDEIFERAMEFVESDLKQIPVEPIALVNSKPSDRMPTCFGMHYTLDPLSSECASCPQIHGCKKLGDLVFSKASAQSGVSDPAADYTRRKDRERQQRCRARKRANDNTSASTRPNTLDQISP